MRNSFPYSQLLSYVYTRAAKAYQAKGDFERVVEYGQKSLNLDPDSVVSLILVSLTLSQPRMAQGSADERAKKLTGAASDATHALELLDKVPKQPKETDEQFRIRKSALAADGHLALGTVRLLRNEYPAAEEEYQKAITSSPNPNAQLYFRLGEAYQGSNRSLLESGRTGPRDVA